MDVDAHQVDDAGMLQGAQHAGLLPELREAAVSVRGPQVSDHGVWDRNRGFSGEWRAARTRQGGRKAERQVSLPASLLTVCF